MLCICWTAQHTADPRPLGHNELTKMLLLRKHNRMCEWQSGAMISVQGMSRSLHLAQKTEPCWHWACNFISTGPLSVVSADNT